MGCRPFVCWDCWFEVRRKHWYLSLVSVVCCQVEVLASGWSLVQRSPTDCGVSEFDREASTMRSPWPTRVCPSIKKMLFIKFDPSPLRKTNTFVIICLRMKKLCNVLSKTTKKFCKGRWHSYSHVSLPGTALWPPFFWVAGNHCVAGWVDFRFLLDTVRGCVPRVQSPFPTTHPTTLIEPSPLYNSETLTRLCVLVRM